MPLRLAPRDGHAIYVHLSTSDGLIEGPLHLARVLGVDGATLDARVEPSHPMSMEEIGSGLAPSGLKGRIVANGRSVWEGSLRVQALRPALSMNPAVEARFSAPMPFGSTLERHFRRRA